MDKIVKNKIVEFFATYPAHTMEDEQILVHAQQKIPGIYYLESGEIKQYDISSSGQIIVVNIYKPNSFFPMSWAINKEPNLYFYEATKKSSYRMAPTDEALKFLKSNNDVMYDLLSRLYTGASGLQRRMAHLMGGTAHTRLLFEILVECRRFGKKSKDGSVILPLTEEEMASRAGLTRETVSRELSKMKKLGMLEVKHSKIIIKDLAVLEEDLGADL